MADLVSPSSPVTEAAAGVPVVHCGPSAVSGLILQTLAGGPTKMTTLIAAVGMTRKRLYRHVHAMHRQGLIRRLGIKGRSRWALQGYKGPRPKVVHLPNLLPKRATLPAKVVPTTFWWADAAGGTRAEFNTAAADRAKQCGWDE
jgi:hypothetical protein